MEDDRQGHYDSYLKIEMEANPDSETVHEAVESQFTCAVNAPGRMAHVFPAVT